MQATDELETIDLECLEKAQGGQRRGAAPARRWQTAEGRREIGGEFAECMTSANRRWLSKTTDWLWNGDNADTRTERDCIDAYNKEMDVPR